MQYKQSGRPGHEQSQEINHKSDREAVLVSRFEFRSVLPEEAAEVAAIEKICFPPNEACSSVHMTERTVQCPSLFLVAADRSSGEISGYMNGIATDEQNLRDEFFTDISLHDPEGSNVMILGISVLPEYRRHGLATSLVRTYASRERSKGRNKLVLTCLDSRVAMYKGMGWRDLGASESNWGGEEWHEMDYRLA